MKKILLAMAVVGVISLSTSCDNKKDASLTQPAEQPTQTQGTEGTTSSDATNVEIPTFSDPSVQEYVNNFSNIAKEFAAAKSSGNVTQIASLTTKLGELQGTASTFVQKLTNPEEMTKFNEWMQKTLATIGLGIDAPK